MSTFYTFHVSFRINYKNSCAQLIDFSVMEGKWRKQLRQLIAASESIHYYDDEYESLIDCLWVNYVPTVLVDMSDEWFVKTNGFLSQTELAEKLCGKVKKWTTRLESYINRSWQAGKQESSAMCITEQKKEQIKIAMPNIEKVKKQVYYRLFHAVNDIYNHIEPYLEQIEESCDMDGTLSLLIAYLRNYEGVTQNFNCKLATLPELYRREILHVMPQGITQDNTYIGITPAEGTKGGILSKGQPSSAGQNVPGEYLIYRTKCAEYISPMQCAEMNAVYFIKKDGKVTRIRKQAVNSQDASTVKTLFVNEHSVALSLGWTVESSMLILNEGNRKDSICFQITTDIEKSLTEPDFLPERDILQLSDVNSWTQQECHYYMDMTGNTQRLCFEFTIAQDGTVPTPCTEEMHGMTTEYPVLRIRTNNDNCPYNWVNKLKFDAIEIQTEVTGICNFTFYNELGEVDTPQSFYPFGIQAEKGAWFLFGNEEMGLKPLQEVRLRVLWKNYLKRKRSSMQPTKVILNPIGLQIRLDKD